MKTLKNDNNKNEKKYVISPELEKPKLNNPGPRRRAIVHQHADQAQNESSLQEKKYTINPELEKPKSYNPKPRAKAIIHSHDD